MLNQLVLLAQTLMEGLNLACLPPFGTPNALPALALKCYWNMPPQTARL